jgi:hypothetical protein
LRAKRAAAGERSEISDDRAMPASSSCDQRGPA